MATEMIHYYAAFLSIFVNGEHSIDNEGQHQLHNYRERVAAYIGTNFVTVRKKRETVDSLIVTITILLLISFKSVAIPENPYFQYQTKLIQRKER